MSDSRTYSSADLPGSRLPAAAASSSRFGPMVPFEPAGAKVWQPAQPAAVKICSPVFAWARPAVASAPSSSPDFAAA